MLYNWIVNFDAFSLMEIGMPIENSSLEQLEQHHDFIDRHIGPSDDQIGSMLTTLSMSSLEELVEKAVPSDILTDRPLNLGEPQTEAAVLRRIRDLANKNQVFKTFIGMGYYNCYTPGVILRNILEDPAWYTAYTPYQAEISQGRMEGLLNFQTMVTEMTGMEIANASLLDEGTAAAEAMSMCMSLQKKKKNMRNCNKFWVMEDIHPQTLEVLQTRSKPLDIELVSGRIEDGFPEEQVFGILLQYPSASGRVIDLEAFAAKAAELGTMVVVATDLLSLALLKPPGEWGADVVIGSSQRFGVPMGFGGPHAGFFATRDAFKRSVPGRIIGVSVDANGKPALRLALQTREQHIRREKATSNICTSQVLLAVMAGMYAVYHGPENLIKMASRVHRFAGITARGIKKLGHILLSDHYFDTLTIKPEGLDLATIQTRAIAEKANLRYDNNGNIGISLDETTTREDVAMLWRILSPSGDVNFTVEELDNDSVQFPENLKRITPVLTHPVFSAHHSETEMLRYLTALSAKDLSLAHSMIPLGSCTMKLNATTQMIPVTWPEFGHIHPFAPKDQVQGYHALITELEDMLSEITGFPGISLQPNAGSQGEYSGMLVIQHYHQSQGQAHRNVCIIPSSAHGTNPASAALAGMKVVVVNCDHEGNIDLEDLRAKAMANKENLSALMITYPSTHGVFETTIREICQIIHENGGQVYMDGANMNALVGLCRPGEFGPDVIHLNLHKTFCIPHGGGGPGVGPIGVGEHLKPYLPGHGMRSDAFPETALTAVSAAPWGSAGILPISWSYIALMGKEGLVKATQTAILSANYIAKRLEDHYPVLYKGASGLVAHECIIDTRPLKTSAGVEAEDIAKRLMDYGFHAPTMSWPVAGTLMIEPTESESKEELDRFCDTMISIRNEIRDIEEGKIDGQNNPLKHAPHAIEVLTTDNWDRPYTREQAVYPLPWLRMNKFWPSVGRVDNAYGDKHLVCSCPPIEAYQ